MILIKNKKYKNEERIREALAGKKLPIVTLDKKWHELFPEEQKTAKINKVEKELLSLLKKQGEYNNEIVLLNKEKSKLMKSIVVNMEVSGTQEDVKRDKKMESIQNSLKDISNQIERMQNDLDEVLPKQIEETNLQLIIESINSCYARMTANSKTITEITEWITGVRDELKEKMLKKNECETSNAQIYSYMHNMMGAELMEIFDIDEPKIIAKLDTGNKI